MERDGIWQSRKSKRKTRFSVYLWEFWTIMCEIQLPSSFEYAVHLKWCLSDIIVVWCDCYSRWCWCYGCDQGRYVQTSDDNAKSKQSKIGFSKWDLMWFLVSTITHKYTSIQLQTHKQTNTIFKERTIEALISVMCNHHSKRIMMMLQEEFRRLK